MYYADSPTQAIMKIFETHKWDIYKFRNVPHGYWEKTSNHKHYMLYLREKLDYTEMDHWYAISQDKFYKNGGCGLLKGYYNNSPTLAVTTVFNNHKWEFFKFDQVTNGCWQHKENQRIYLEWLGNQKNYKTRSDWYKISTQDFFQNFGTTLLNVYHGSPSECVMNVFDNHDWIYWMFNSQKGDVSDPKYLQWVAEEVGNWQATLNLSKPIDWYTVDAGNIYKNVPHGAKILDNHNGLCEVLNLVYPHEYWDELKFKGFFNCKGEKLMIETLKSFFPNSPGVLYALWCILQCC